MLNVYDYIYIGYVSMYIIYIQQPKRYAFNWIIIKEKYIGRII